MPVGYRPADPDLALTQDERTALIRLNAWPLSWQARQLILERPADRKRRESLTDRRIERVALDLLEAELPAALDALRRGRRCG